MERTVEVVSPDDVSELAELLIDIAGSWELFLGALGVSGDTRDQIRLKHPYSPKLCLLEGLEHWVISNDSPTYESVIKALRGKFVTNKRLASAIEEFVKQKYGVTVAFSFVENATSDEQAETVPLQCISSPDDLKDSAKTQCHIETVHSPPANTEQDIHLKLNTAQAKEKSKKLQKEFTSLVRQLKNHLKYTFTDQLLPEFLDGFIMELPLSVKDEHEKFFHRTNSEINRATTFDELFTCLSTYWDYLNYSLLDGVIDAHGTEELKQEMECYVRDVEEFCRKTTLKVFWELEPRKIRTKPPSGFSQFVTKHSITRESTLEDIENIRLEITKEFNLHMCVLLLVHVVEGSVVITWFVPSSVVSLLKHGLTRLGFLRRLHIEDVTFDVESPDVPKDYQTVFLDAAESGDTERVKELLSTGVDVNVKGTESGWTALMSAAISGHTSTVSALLEAGADVNVADKDGRTAHIWAAFSGHTSTVSALLEAGADVNVADKDGRTALMSAAISGHTSTVSALLEAGADVNVADKDGRTAHIWAAFSGHTSTVSALLEAGADVNIGDKYGRTALLEAAFNGHTDTVSALLDAGADVNIGDKYGRTALMEATFSRQTSTTSVILEAGADMNVGDIGGWTALMLAAVCGHTNTVQALVAAGADLNIQNSDGDTVLITALQNEHLDIAETLIRAGADINQQEKTTGWNALFFAAKLGSLPLVRLLLERGADPTVKDKEAYTALHIAKVHGHAEILRDIFQQHTTATVDVTENTETMRTRVLHASKLLKERFAKYIEELALPGRAEKKRAQSEKSSQVKEPERY